MPTFSNAHALVVGIASYERVTSLPQAVRDDAQAIRDLLIDASVCGYEPANVQLLLDHQATRARLLRALSDLAARCHADSTAFVYLSCHGARITQNPLAGEYLLTFDSRLDTSQALASTAISGDEFTAALNRIPAGKVLVIFDCCHAGGIGSPKDASAIRMKTGLSENYYDALKQGRGRVIMASSRGDELSWILPGAANSLFTQHLLGGLRGGIEGGDGLIRVFDLFEYIQPRVTADQSNQHPIFKAEIEENFPVALRLGGQAKAARLIDDDFRYHAYISYVDREPDSTWVWDTLVPRLEGAGLVLAVSGDAEEAGVARVVNVERGIRQAKRTVVVLSENYLADHMAGFENVLAQTLGIEEGMYRLLPIKIEAIDEDRLPTRLSMLATLNLAHPRRAERELGRLIEALEAPLPRR